MLKVKTFLNVVLTVALLSLEAEAEKHGLVINKCCGLNQMLDNDGLECIDTFWPHNISVISNRYIEQTLVPPFDAQWIRRWLPPGTPLEKISTVWLEVNPQFLFPFYMTAINSSFVLDNTATWNDTMGEERSLLTLHGDTVLLPNPRNRGFQRTTNYCIDGKNSPDATYALLVTSNCKGKDIIKCCSSSQFMDKDSNGKLHCKSDKEARRRFLSLLKDVGIPENSYEGGVFPPNCLESGILHLKEISTNEVRDMTRYCLNPRITNAYSTLTWECVDLQRIDDTLRPVNVYCDYWRPSKGVYLLARYLSYVSIFLLAMALVSIVSDSHTRSTVHGWCLGCHGTCLLFFNLAQVTFFRSFSDKIKELRYLPVSIESSCTVLGFSMYFLLMSAASWLTAVCINLAFGFRASGTPHAKSRGSDRRRFLTLSVFAWGFPLSLTAGSCYIFVTSAERAYIRLFDYHEKKIAVFYKPTDIWYWPSLFETRSCFNDIQRNADEFRSVKYGSLLWYYGPVSALVLVNLVCLGITMRRIAFLRRGNSILRREEYRRQQVKKDSKNKTEEYEEKVSKDNEKESSRGSFSDSQSVVLYIKLLLSAGLLETLTETAVWATSVTAGQKNKDQLSNADHTFAYRTAGCVADFCRAVMVLWLATPNLRRAICCRNLASQR